MESNRKPDTRKLTTVVTKSIAVKTFMKIAKKTSSLLQEATPGKQSDPAGKHSTLSVPHIDTHSSMLNMILKDKRDSEMRREIDSKHVRIQTPKTRRLDCLVRRERSARRGKRRTVGVLRPADPESQILWRRVAGPKLGDNGTILPHSILGDVQSFVSEATQRGEFQDLIQNVGKTKKEAQVIPAHKTSVCSYKQLLDEEKALTNWELEMFYRNMGQKRLAKIVNRPVRDLLMTRSDDFVRRNEIRNLIQQQGVEKFHPDVCFWTLEPRYGNGQVMTTLTKTERGLVSTPVISADGSIAEKEKGKKGVSIPNMWHESEYLQRQMAQVPGVIHIANTQLFKKLEVQGAGVDPPKQSNSLICQTVDVGEDKSRCTSHQHPDINVGSGTEQECQRDENKFPGPSLRVGSTDLRWLGREVNESGCHKDLVVTEEFILITTNVGEIAKSHMTFENNGTVVLKYLWRKEPVFHPLPVNRPPRRPFYCYDDAGAIRPGEIIHVPVLFRSSIPGYFTESWLLETIPILEGGAKIRFNLKGVARDLTDYTQECLEIEEYLRKKQVATLCYLEAKHILDSAILKASLNLERLRDDPICMTREETFEKINPGFNFIESVIKDLWVLYDIASKDVTPDKKDSKALDPVLSVSKLRNMILNLPCLICEDEDDHLLRQNELFKSFYRHVMLLSFCPLLPWQPRFHQKYIVMYALLQHGVDRFTHRASRVADTLGLVIEDVIETVKEVKDNTKGKGASIKAKAKISTASSLGKAKGKEAKDPSPTHENTRTPTTKLADDVEFPQFSTITKFKQAHGTKCKNVQMYEERTYLMMYEILVNTLDTFDIFFKTDQGN